MCVCVSSVWQHPNYRDLSRLLNGALARSAQSEPPISTHGHFHPPVTSSFSLSLSFYLLPECLLLNFVGSTNRLVDNAWLRLCSFSHVSTSCCMKICQKKKETVQSVYKLRRIIYKRGLFNVIAQRMEIHSVH